MRITKRQLRQIIRETVQQRPARRRSRALREAAMARPELNRILKQHRLWLDTNGREGAQADLRGANLRHADLRDADLRDANLLGVYLWDADLRGADLGCAKLQGANLWDANLQGANLWKADLQGANLLGANLQGAQLDTNISHCLDFQRAAFTADALPWLILHPKWSEWKDVVQIEES